jgi:uncharacterized protein
LSDEEFDELDDFLLSDATSDETMMIDALDGYLTAIAIGPTSIPMSQWMSGIWGDGEEDAPHFATLEQAKHIMELILRHYNGIIWSLEDDPDGFEPVFNTMTYPDDPHEYLDGEMWAYGFMRGIGLSREDWQPLFEDKKGQGWLRPLILLGADEVTPEEDALVRWPNQREEIAKQIPQSIAAIYRYWLPYREAVHERTVAQSFQQANPKVGRNDPCPCGSGKKFKKCCGAGGELH